MPFLASCQCPTRVGVQHVLDTKIGTICQTLVSEQCLLLLPFFFFASLTRLQHVQHASSEKKKEEKKKKENHRFWQMDLPIPLILWYTLKQQVWEVIRLKPTSHSQVFTSQPTLPLTFARCHYPLSLVRTRSSRLVSSIDVDAVTYPFWSFSLPRCGQQVRSDLFKLLSGVLFFYYIFFSRYLAIWFGWMGYLNTHLL